MLLNYPLREEDFLTYQLYIASQSDRIRKRRIKDKLVLPIIYAVLGGIFLYMDDPILGFSFIAFGVLWFFIYPLWERKRYVQHYRDFINEHYKERLDKEAYLEIGDDFFITKDEASEGKVATTQIKEIVELPDLILVILYGGVSFLIPKNRLDTIDEVIEKLKHIANNLKIPYALKSSWQWR